MSSRKVVKDAVSAAANKAAKPIHSADCSASSSPTELSTEGSPNAEIQALVIQTWMEEAKKAGVSVAGLDPKATVTELIVWARAAGLLIAAVLSRFSTKLQHSTEAQVFDCVKFAAQHGMFVVPHFVCVDEATKGRKENRVGVNRMKTILERRLIDVLLVYKVSRLFRKTTRGFSFLEEEVVERNMRGIAVTQNVDTNDTKSWKLLCCMHGLSDEMLLDAISDHVRSGLADLFRNRFVTGAIPVGYMAKEVPGGRPTKLGKPRTMPVVNPEVASLIRKHFEYHRDGMPISTGWKLWLQAGGPCDPRSTTRQMSRAAYRRMLRNPRYIGRWAFGQKRNVWSSKLDYMKQELQPESEVTIFQCEELRIVSDELFFSVQARLPRGNGGRRGPKGKNKRPQIWDMVAEFFVCSECSQHEDQRFYHYGSGNKSMVCRNRELCPRMTAIKRLDAVRAVVDELCELVNRDADLVAAAITRVQEIDGRPDEDLISKAVSLRSRIAVQNNKIGDLYEVAGSGTEEDRTETKSRIKSAQVRRSELQAELSRVEQQMAQARRFITPHEVQGILGDFRRLLESAAAGTLGEDLVYRAAYIFKLLVGGRILVCVDQRPCRKRTVVRGKFKPYLFRAVADQLSVSDSALGEPAEVEVWLRPPPQCDLLAVRVHDLVDNLGLSYGEAAEMLVTEGHRLMSAVQVSNLYGRHYEMIGEPRPKHPYNNGRRPKPKRPRS